MTAPPATSPTSLKERALRLAGAARALASGQEAQQAEQKTRTNLSELNTALTTMRETATSARAAANQGVAMPEVNWNDGLKNLQEHVRRGRPSPQALAAATKRVRATNSEAEKQLRETWAAWSANQLTDPVLQRLPLMHARDRATYKQHLDRLGDLARSKKAPRASDVAEFSRLLAGLREALQDIADDDKLTDLMHRLAQPSGVRLCDLSDDQLAALRKYPELSGQIWLTRK